MFSTFRFISGTVHKPDNTTVEFWRIHKSSIFNGKFFVKWLKAEIASLEKEYSGSVMINSITKI